MGIAIVTHESVLHHRGWTLEQIHRVLDKLPDDDVTVRLDPGFALDVAETLAASGREFDVLVAQPNWLPMWQAYARHHSVRRLEGIVNTGRARVTFLAPDEGARVSWAKRDEVLAAMADTHVVVYDGRDRGSVVRYLQLVLGVQPTVLINPATQRVTVHKEQIPCTSTSPTASTSPSIA